MITFQPEFRPVLPVVYGPKEYTEFRETLEEMDRILRTTGLEIDFIKRHFSESATSSSCCPTQSASKIACTALRHAILLALTNESYRGLSLRISDSALLQWFTTSAQIDAVRPASKSTIERYSKMFSSESVTWLIHELNRTAGDEKYCEELLVRKTALSFDQIFADTTCVKANIHFPVDWVLLRDAVRTLTKAIEVIRSSGLHYRISEPSKFLSNMNKLCMEMSGLRKKRDASKKRKMVLRRMKKLTKTVQKHAENYYRELSLNWEKTSLSHLQAQVVLRRIENILSQLPKAIKQAHERIIGERRVGNKDKILSFYEPDIHVLVRGKAGAEVEFGNALYLAEQSDGLIVDWQFIKDQPPGDNKLVKAGIERISAEYGKPKSYTADRGFDSTQNNIDLEGDEIINAICPRSVPLLEQKLEDELFCRLQKRRGSTEARIGIFKNAWLGVPFRSKGFNNRQIRIEFCILTHNLWKLASMAAGRRKELLQESTKAA
jgi:IS5 family transposase